MPEVRRAGGADTYPLREGEVGPNANDADQIAYSSGRSGRPKPTGRVRLARRLAARAELTRSRLVVRVGESAPKRTESGAATVLNGLADRGYTRRLGRGPFGSRDWSSLVRFAVFGLLGVAVVGSVSCDRTVRPGDRVPPEGGGMGSVGKTDRSIRLTLHKYRPGGDYEVDGRSITFEVPSYYTSMTSSRDAGAKHSVHLIFERDAAGNLERYRAAEHRGDDDRVDVSLSIDDPLSVRWVRSDSSTYELSGVSRKYTDTGKTVCGYRLYEDPIPPVGMIPARLYIAQKSKKGGIDVVHCPIRAPERQSLCSTETGYSVFRLQTTSGVDICNQDIVVQKVRKLLDSHVSSTTRLPPR